MRILKVTRRELLLAGVSGAAAGAAGLALGFRTGARRERWAKRVPARAQAFSPNVYLAIDADDSVTIWVTRSEMGQGVRTALPMILAEELDADWAKVRLEHPVANENYGGMFTAASESVRGLWTDLRQAGATARAMLVQAAAQLWEVPAEACSTDAGFVIHDPTGRRSSYGALTTLAAALPVPKKAALKDPKSFRLLGQRLPRVDLADKTNGRALFGIDVRVAGMRYAAIARCPTIGGKVQRLDASAAKRVPGVREVLQLDDRVAVLAEGVWAAFEGKRALDVTWQHGPVGSVSTPALAETLRTLARTQTGPVAFARGDAGRAGNTPPLELLYQVPYLAHAPMEPINCTARVMNGACEIWAPTQDPDGVRETAARITGLPLSNVLVHTTLLGGGFGRRSLMDEAIDAVTLAHRTRGAVQVVWSREDDIQHDHYREAAAHYLRIGRGPGGLPETWFHRVASPSIIGVRPGETRVDSIAVQGSVDLPYGIPNVRVEWVNADLPVPVGIWRSVARSHSAFAIECALDEVATASGLDPVAMRRSLLTESPRLRACLEVAATRAGWGRPLPAGHGRGVATHSCYGSHVAQIAEVSVDAERGLRVHRVVCAIDCGQTVNPDTIEAQIEGGIVFGLSAALHGEITVEKGQVVQSNFTDYPLLRMDEMPIVEVAILPSHEDPGGVGELGVPTIAPAVANAIFAATGKRVRTLPIRLS